MIVSVNHLTRVITIPQADLTFVSTGLYHLDVNDFHLWLKEWEAAEANIDMPDTHVHFPEVSVGGVTLAAVVQIINSYTITFENGIYGVALGGANNNIADVLNINSVSLRSNNSAGLTAAQDPEMVANAVFATTVEGSHDFQQALKLMLAVLAGKVSGGGTSTVTFRDTTDTISRIIATVDAQGNRTAVTLNDS